MAVRLPTAVVEAPDLQPADNIEIHVKGDRSFDSSGGYPIAATLLLNT